MPSTKPNRAARRRAAKQETKQPTVYFDGLLTRFVDLAVGQVNELKTHKVGAHTYGSDGLFVVGLETMTAAQRSGNPNAYITAAAYALAAAIHACGAWDAPNEPKPEVPGVASENPPPKDKSV